MHRIQHILDVFPYPHGGGVQMPKLRDEVGIGKHIRIGELFTDIGKDADPPAEFGNREQNGTAVCQGDGDGADQAVHLGLL